MRFSYSYSLVLDISVIGRDLRGPVLDILKAQLVFCSNNYISLLRERAIALTDIRPYGQLPV